MPKPFKAVELVSLMNSLLLQTARASSGPV
jgi:hypothetical protein